MDLIQQIGSSKLYNFHSHTQFCDGRDVMCRFAEAACAAGFTDYGFSPHSPVPIESPCNMTMDSVPLYIDEAMRLRRLYRDRMRIYISMEIDFLGKEWGPSHPYFDSLPLDYRIGSVHFIKSQDGVPVDIDGRYDNFRLKMHDYFHDDIRYVVDTFFDASMEMVELGGFDIIGHLDKIGHNAGHYSPDIEKEEWYQRHVSRLIDAVLARDLIIEINTKAWEEHHRFFPATRHWRRLLDGGARIIVNSDAHRPELINASRPLALSLLESLK